jgi:hypothetical protein
MRNFSGKSPSLLSDEHLRAIGAVIVNWNALEIVLEILALGFYQIPLNRGLIFTANLSFQNKLTVLRIAGAHGAISDEQQKRSFISFLERIEQAHNKRNAIVHGQWAGGKVQGLAKRMALRVRGRKLSTAVEQIPLAEIEAIATEFLELHGELASWVRVFGVPSDLPISDTDEQNPK